MANRKRRRGRPPKGRDDRLRELKAAYLAVSKEPPPLSEDTAYTEAQKTFDQATCLAAKAGLLDDPLIQHAKAIKKARERLILMRLTGQWRLLRKYGLEAGVRSPLSKDKVDRDHARRRAILDKAPMYYSRENLHQALVIEHPELFPKSFSTFLDILQDLALHDLRLGSPQAN